MARSFFAYSLENCFHPHDNCRFNFNANMTQRDIEDTYLPAFQTTVEVGRVTGLMCSENSGIESAVTNCICCSSHTHVVSFCSSHTHIVSAAAHIHTLCLLQ